jgi:preprotein translocase subunit SecE
LAGGRPLTGQRPAPPPGEERLPGTGRKLKMLQKIQEFFKEVSVELKKVSWPTRQQTMNATVVVIAVSFVVAFFLGIVDIVLARVVGSIMK